jgi:hypothetical protein
MDIVKACRKNIYIVNILYISSIKFSLFQHYYSNSPEMYMFQFKGKNILVFKKYNIIHFEKHGLWSI